jgi:aminoglycoside phosphotransferase (APT) family kinase protein
LTSCCVVAPDNAIAHFQLLRTTSGRTDAASGYSVRDVTSNDPQQHAETAPFVSANSLAPALGAELLQALAGRLHDLHWFRTDWQRGGAGTAFAKWRDEDGCDRDVVVKVPVNLREFRWMRRVAGEADGPVAQLITSGTALGPYDFAWIVIERLRYGPLGLNWHADHFDRMCEAAARFHRSASAIPIEGTPLHEDWDKLLGSARDHVRESRFPERSRWMHALKDFSKKADKAIDRWHERKPVGWIHGDLHPANAMSRIANDHGPACLIDLAEVRIGHWVEDAVYLERLHWVKPERLSHKPVKCLAEARRRNGLEVGDYPMLASIRRALLAATAPAFKGEHSPLLLAACLARLEEGMREIH